MHGVNLGPSLLLGNIRAVLGNIRATEDVVCVCVCVCVCACSKS